MSEPYLAEIRMMGFNFAPRGWALCDGQILSINQNQSLYSLLGTTYGGDGRTTFGLPDLRGRTPVHVGDGYPLGLNGKGGVETVTLTTQQIASHTHGVMVSNSAGDSATPANMVLAQSASNIYLDSQDAEMSPHSLTNTGGGGSYNNMQPFLTINFCIATLGLFPPRN